MRCKNCHTVMMDTDSHCPGCRSPVERATAGAPGAIGQKPNGLLMLLPIFGGAVGGLAYAALTSGQNSGPTLGPSLRTGQARGSHPVRWTLGLLFLIGGGLFVVLAAIQAFDTWDIARREPTVVTAAELRRKDYAMSAPNWLVYTFTESKPTEHTAKRRRLGNRGEVEANCLLVRVGNRWLVTTVAPGFEGDKLVGRIPAVDSPATQSLIERVRAQHPQPATVLPYEFNAVDGCASDQQLRYFVAGWIALFGVVGLLLGFCLIPRRPATQIDINSIVNEWEYQPVPKT